VGLEPSGDEAWENLRISAGLPKWSVDYSSQDTPHHAGLFGRAVATNKGCYIGQEVVCKVEMIGHVSQRLTRLKLDTLADVVVGADVRDGQTGESAGIITSVAGGLPDQSGWAIARIKSALIDKGAVIRVGQSQGRIVDMLRA
jgi:folate-binding protein YgfZ